MRFVAYVHSFIFHLIHFPVNKITKGGPLFHAIRSFITINLDNFHSSIE